MDFPLYRYVRARLAARGLLPRTRVARFTSTLAAIAAALLVLALLSWVLGWPNLRAYLVGWVTFLSYVVACGLLLLGWRWLRARMLWRLRNRLIVTYMFVGFMPGLLLVAMALIAGYALAGQFATFVATSDFQAELAQLDASNAAVAATLAAQLERKVAPAQAAESLRARAATNAPLPAHLTFWYHDQATVVQGAGPAIAAPAWLKEGFRGVVTEHDRSHWLRAARRITVRGEPLTIIAAVPLDIPLLSRLADKLGIITLYLENDPASRSGRKSGITVRSSSSPAVLTVDSETGTSSSDSLNRIAAGTLPPPTGRMDRDFTFPTLFEVTNWSDGVQHPLVMTVTTRPSLLYQRLFATLGEYSGVVFNMLVGFAILFALIGLFALYIAGRLTRSITRSVHNLYFATEKINRGEFRHRIHVRSNDQLAALETSFNSMSSSLERLLAEQKEKQRIENELAIAQEVQEQLFPRQVRSLETLEVHGICRPARTVSGDYYDFLALGHEKLGIAVGDVSGKGISAALLMATINSAVRAYTMGRSGEALEVPLMAAVGAADGFEPREPDSGSDAVTIAPAELLALLNRQLFHSTPAEKYATLFLGTYDGLSRTLTYSNGGHLPPIILGADGAVRRLESSGMAIGLFDDQTYGQSSVELRPGDLFISFSDGVTEPENDFGEFGEARLLDLIRENRHLPLDRISDEAIIAVRDWIGGAEQPDDITLVLARAR